MTLTLYRRSADRFI